LTTLTSISCINLTVSDASL